jgi:transcriptional regulator with XRE-family HTH domain
MTAKRTAAEELGKRVLAARKYRGVSQVKLAKRLKVGPDTLGRWEAGKTDKDYKQDAMIKAAVSETKLPREFFSIDFKDLPAMVRAWRQAQPEAAGELALMELETELEAESQQSDPSEKRTGGSKPESESR